MRKGEKEMFGGSEEQRRKGRGKCCVLNINPLGLVSYSSLVFCFSSYHGRG